MVFGNGGLDGMEMGEKLVMEEIREGWIWLFLEK